MSALLIVKSVFDIAHQAQPRNADLESHFRLSVESTKTKPVVLKAAAPTCPVSTVSIWQKPSKFPNDSTIRNPLKILDRLCLLGARLFCVLRLLRSSLNLGRPGDVRAVRLQRLAAEALHAPLCALLAGAASQQTETAKLFSAGPGSPAGKYSG